MYTGCEYIYLPQKQVFIFLAFERNAESNKGLARLEDGNEPYPLAGENIICTTFRELPLLHCSCAHHIDISRTRTRAHARTQTVFNRLKPNDTYRGRTAPLTSKLFILYIYSTNICTEYFKHGIYSPFFPLQIVVCFIIITYLVPVLFTFYIQGVLKLKK